MGVHQTPIFPSGRERKAQSFIIVRVSIPFKKSFFFLNMQQLSLPRGDRVAEALSTISESLLACELAQAGTSYI